MTLHCERCAVLIEHDNRHSPGFCTVRCQRLDERRRYLERRDRQQARAGLDAARAERQR